MNWLKIFKIKMFFLALCLSSVCFGENTSGIAYETLLSSAKKANFVKFKELYSQSSISDQQKQELSAILNDIIETERKYWRSHRPVGHESAIGAEIKTEIKLGYVLAAVFGLITPVWFWYIVSNYLRDKDRFSSNYQALRNGFAPIGNHTTAAVQASRLDRRYSFWFSELKIQALLSCFFLVPGISLLAVTKLNHTVLRSYKRWKKAWKIKGLIEHGYTNLSFSVQKDLRNLRNGFYENR